MSTEGDGRENRDGISSVTKIHGVDFSGAVDAGKRIWISCAVVESGRLRISQARPASELPGSGTRRAAALAALTDFIRGEGGAAIGLDFPFGLPRAVVAESSWKEFVLAFRSRYPSAEAFRETCRSLSKRELRRASDREARAPWAAWNWRLFRQTFFGIGSVLAPLVSADQVRVLPMDSPDGARPLLLEICPASTLRRLGIAGLPYKGGAGRIQRRARRQILDHLTRNRSIELGAESLERALDDGGGDAVDSIVAAAAVYDAVVNERLMPDSADFQLEGRVYF